MAATIISCCCRRLVPPPAPKQGAAAGAHTLQAPAGVSADVLRRACVAAAACAVMGMAGVGAAASRTEAVAAGAKAPPRRPRWSDRRQCPPWRANSLENVVPENLPRPSAPRRFDSVSASAAALPDLVAPPPFQALRPGTGCFSL